MFRLRLQSLAIFCPFGQFCYFLSQLKQTWPLLGVFFCCFFDNCWSACQPFVNFLQPSTAFWPLCRPLVLSSLFATFTECQPFLLTVGHFLLLSSSKKKHPEMMLFAIILWIACHPPKLPKDYQYLSPPTGDKYWWPLGHGSPKGVVKTAQPKVLWTQIHNFTTAGDVFNT